jgi:hypothetical protein
MHTNHEPSRPTRTRGRPRVALRCLALAFLLAAVGLPVGEVHSVQLPRIQKLTIVGNDLEAVRGIGAPGQSVWLWTRQRNFREDDRTPLDLGCAGNSAGWLQLVELDDVDAKGNFFFDGLDLMVFPSGTGFQNCNAALLTEFLVGFGIVPEEHVPALHMMNVPNYLAGSDEKWLEADIEFADEVGIMITDGPNDKPEALGGVDVDEDGADLCAVNGLGCGARVSYLGSGGTFSAPSIWEHDGSTFGIPTPQIDDEFPFTLAMVQAHAPGASLLATAKIPRNEAPTGGTLLVNVDVKADIDIDCKGGPRFDFPF